MRLAQRIQALEPRGPQRMCVESITRRIEELRAADQARGVIWPEPDEETHRIMDGLRQFLRSQHARA